MTITYRDEKFIFNEEESKEAVRICSEFLKDMHKQCTEKEIETFYVMLLFVMHDITEKAIDGIGIDGVMSMFMRRVHTERVADGTEVMESEDIMDVSPTTVEIKTGTEN